jgi:hypothetical protein
MEVRTENIFYCEKNSSDLCTEGAIGNLMDILHCPKNDVEQFWDFFQSPNFPAPLEISPAIGEWAVPLTLKFYIFYKGISMQLFDSPPS